MSPKPKLLDLLASAFSARTGAWIQSVSRAERSVSPSGFTHDPRICNSRREFDALANHEIARARDKGENVTVAILDIDHLSAVNDDHGFDIGDRLIDQVHFELSAVLQPTDLAVSLGCGSWALLLSGVGPIDAHEYLDSVRDQLERRIAIHFATDHASDLTVSTFSVGLFVSEGAAVDLPELLQAASQANLASKLAGGSRTSCWDESTIETVGRSAGRRRAQRDAQLSTVLSLAEALDLRDTDTSNHSNMVARYAEMMAQELGMDEDHVKRVRIAGLLHDIGKIGVPDSVLRKPAKLNDEEWAMMQAHPNIGARLLASIDAEDIRSWVLAHHERPDGRGYPLGLKGDEIPLEAKILSVADAYEAMTVDRVYRSAPGPEIARAELERLRDLQFDSEVVSVFLRVLERIEAEGTQGPAPSIMDAGAVLKELSEKRDAA